MTGSSNLIGDLTRAFDIANIEMLAVTLPEAVVTGVSQATLARWGSRREELIGRQIVNFGTGALSARNVPGNDGEEPRIEVAFVPPLGSIKTSLFTPQTWREGARDVMLLIGQHGNAAAAEQAIQNEKRLQLALRSGGYAVWDFDYRTRDTTNSPEMYDLLGFPRDDPDLNFNFFNSLVHPDDRRKTLDEQIRLSPFGSDVFQTKYRVRAANGEYVWIESVAGVIRDPLTGGPAKVVGLCRNVDAEMTAVERLSVSEHNLKRSQQAARLGSFSLKRKGVKSKLSTEMIALLQLESGAEPPTLADFEAMIDAHERGKFQDMLAAALDGEHPPGIDIEVRLKSGADEHFHCHVEPEFGDDGRVLIVHGTCQCISEQKNLERKFLQAQRMEAVGQLTGGIAHDFNNLLMVVMGNLQLVEQLVRTDNRALTRIRAAIEASEKGSELTKRLLAFSRQQTLRNKELAVNELAQRMEPALKSALGPLVDITIAPGENLWPIKADAMMMETAILNLALNARDAMMPKGGKLLIETANVTLDSLYCTQNEEVFPGDYVEIAVTDNGIGIGKENLDKVFQPFFTTKGPEAGSGLGLSMIYGFVRQSNGHVKIQSEPGHGTTVRMFLPKSIREPVKLQPPEPAEVQVEFVEEELDAEPMPAPLPVVHSEMPSSPMPPPIPQPEPYHSEGVILPFPPAAAAPRQRTVLVVEDNDGVRNVAVAMLEDMDIITLQASNGRDALALLQSRSDIDLVLSDVVMAGGMNGTELAIQALKFRPDLKIVFMSGYTPDSVRQTKGLPDTIDLVNKPFTRSDLTEKIYRALAA